MLKLTDYILEDFKISHKISRLLYRGIKPEKNKGLCLRLSIANYNPHIEISVSHYLKNNDNSISYKNIKYNDSNYVNVKFDEKYYIDFNDYWDTLLLFDDDAIKFLYDLYGDKRQKVDLSIFTSNNKLNKSLNVKKYNHNVTTSLIFYEDDEINTMIKQIQTQTWNV